MRGSAFTPDELESAGWPANVHVVGKKLCKAVLLMPADLILNHSLSPGPS